VLKTARNAGKREYENPVGAGFFKPWQRATTMSVKFDSMKKPEGKVRIRQEYKIEYADPIRVAAGGRVSVGREDNEFPGWKWCRASDGREGWVPKEFLSGEGAEATALHDYSALELAVQPGEEVVIEDARHDWLLVRNANGERGWIPASHIES
jgi:SH3-like domain-containing protein